MSTMITEVYDAFVSAGAPDDKVRAAAVALADYQKDIAELRSDNRLIKWMVGFNLTLTAAVFAKLFLG